MYTLEQVRAELLAICDANPDKTGRLSDSMEDTTGPGCFYFLHEDGTPIDGDFHEDDPSCYPDLKKATPCCIVGRWLFLHPELLADEEIVKRAGANMGLEGSQWLSSEVDAVEYDAGLLLEGVQVWQDTGAATPFSAMRQRIASYESGKDFLGEED